MNLLDPIGASFSLLCTYYFTKAKRIAWILGIIAIILNSILYWQKEIYGVLLLEGIYFISMIYGWYQWSFDVKTNKQSINFLTFKQMGGLTLIAFLCILIMASILNWMGSDIPYLDATTTTLSMLAQLLLCLKIIHCWIVWFIVDALMALMQLYKGLPYHSVLYGSYLILAVLGFIRWRKIMKTDANV